MLRDCACPPTNAEPACFRVPSDDVRGQRMSCQRLVRVCTTNCLTANRLLTILLPPHGSRGQWHVAVQAVQPFRGPPSGDSK